MKTEMERIVKTGINVVLKTGEPDKTTWQEFFLIIISYLSFNRKIDLNEVKRLSIDLSNTYNAHFKVFDSVLAQSFDMLKVLKDGKKVIMKRLNPILEEIEKLKEFKNGKGNKDKTVEIAPVSERLEIWDN